MLCYPLAGNRKPIGRPPGSKWEETTLAAAARQEEARRRETAEAHAAELERQLAELRARRGDS
jgi:predicted secreted Zn-dependent protease